MNDISQEIDELVEYFREIDRKFELVKQSEEYKQWHREPIARGKLSETKEFEIILWEDTPREKLFVQRISKIQKNMVRPKMP